nr:MAG TPA: hypothetical protein [Caudoviricetes sp.]
MVIFFAYLSVKLDFLFILSYPLATGHWHA